MRFLKEYEDGAGWEPALRGWVLNNNNLAFVEI